MKTVGLEKYKKYFDTIEASLRQKTLERDLQNDVLAIQSLKRKIRVIKSEFMKSQNRSKLITVNPLFNRKEYLGKNTEPMPVERYLVEINYPEVKIAYKNNIYEKQLDEADVEFLIRSNFQKWMLYLINSHFRAELNVGNDQPIPRLSDLVKGNPDHDSLIDKRLNLHENDLRDAIVRDDIHFNGRLASGRRQQQSQQETIELDDAREKLSKWFP